MSILVVGGDSAEVFRQRAARHHGEVHHWRGRKTRDLAKPIPKHTQAIVVILDRISHALARKIRTEAVQRGLPVFFQRRGRQSRSTDDAPLGLAHWIEQKPGSESNKLRSKSNRY